MNRINRHQNGQTLRRLFLIGLSILLLGITQIAQAGEHYPACNRGDKLITAVNNASANGEADYIGLVGPGCTYTVDKTLVIKADNGQPVTIEGNGSVISGGNKVRVLDIEPGAVVILQNIIIEQGKSSDDGGGIRNSGNLTLTGTTLYSNHADSHGGGLYNNGNVTITSSTVQGNTAIYGGGIYHAAGDVNIAQSFITLNEASYGGGGILNAQYTKLTINNTFIASNHAQTSGGGVTSYGDTLLKNTRVDSNSAGSFGGGLYVGSSKMNFTHSALLANTAYSGGGLFNATYATSHFNSSTVTLGIASYGGGIQNEGTLKLTNATVAYNSATVSIGGLLNKLGNAHLENSILAHNTGADCNNEAKLTSGTTNLIADGSCKVNDSVISGDPGLESLTAASEFAPPYYPLSPLSWAIDAGWNTYCWSWDQRGIERPMDGDGDGMAVCDLGAYEADTVAPVTATPTATDIPGKVTMTPTAPGTTQTPTAPVTPTAPAEEPGIELLTNGGFEQKDANDKAVLTPWTVKNGSGDKVKCNALYSKDGSCAFRFKGSASENAKLGQNVKLDTFTFAAGQTLDLSAFVSTDSLSVSGKIKLSVKYTDPALVPDKVSVDLRATNGYEKLGGQVTLKSGSVAKIKLQVNHRSANGKLFIDSVSLKQQPVESMLLPLP